MSEPQHAKLSASSSNIWINCTGSVELNKGKVRKATVYTDEGSMAHTLAEQCLRHDVSPPNLVGSKPEITQDMADAVLVYYNHCDALKVQASWYETEQRVSLDGLWPNTKPPTKAFGTADFVYGMSDVIGVVDYKHGKGVAVEVKNNSQLRYYGLGVILKLVEAGKKLPAWIELTIVQPRAVHQDGPIRTERLLVLDLLIWGKQVIRKTVDDIFAGNTNLKTGDHCRWCPSLGSCPEVHREAFKTAKMEFGKDQPVEPNTLNNDALAHVLGKAELMKKWIAAVQAEASSRIDQGQEVPGWKLVPKRGIRKWKDEAEAEIWLKDTLGGEEYVYIKKILSPPQAEKSIKKGSTPEHFLKGFNDLVTKESSGTTLVPDADNRPATGGPAADFDQTKTALDVETTEAIGDHHG